MPVSPAQARRAAAWLEAALRHGVLGTDPEVVGYAVDLIRFVGEATVEDDKPEPVEDAQ